LGWRTADDFADVAHGRTVARFVDTAQAVGPGSLVNGTIHRSGDYDVFRFTPGVTQALKVSTLRGGPLVDTTILVYEGESLVAFNNNRTATDIYSQVTHTFEAGVAYRIVVGSAGGAGAGAYRLWVAAPGEAHPDDRAGPRVIDMAVQFNAKGLPTGI